MKIQQLMEGQKEQIEHLRPNGPVALYYPTDIEDAVEVLRTTNMNKGDKLSLRVMPSLKHAVHYSDLVMMFYARGKDLYPPREVVKNRRDKEIAAQAYPESFRPEVSFSLSSQRPVAIYHGHLTPGNVEKIFFVRDGRPEPVDMKQFVDYLINYRATDRKRQQDRVDIQHESTILRRL